MHHVVASPVNLVSGSKINISCNASVVHGYSAKQVGKINATFYLSTSSSTAANDNNYHYADSNCTVVANTSNAKNVSCVFELYYYASSGSWYCNISAFTLANLTNSSVAPATVEDLYAIGADPILDYGSLGPGMLSADNNLSLYNFGNRDINITVEGYGKVKDDNLSMGCYPKGNISSANERYSIKYQSQFSLMANLSSRPKLIKNLVLAHRTNDYIYTNDTNKTFWKLSMPLGLRGSCNGTIIFSAIAP
jgi:hypothetical protein